MFVYVISSTESRHKIGIARAPAKRLKELQTGSGDPLTIINLWDVGLYRAAIIERAAHGYLSDRRAEGEWFDISAADALGAVERAISVHGADPDEPMSNPKKSPTSLRVPPDVIAGVEAWADQHKCPRNAAYVRLLRLGLEAERSLTRKPARVAEPPADPVRTKAELDANPASKIPAVHVAVPKLERKPFNPQPKTGKAKGK